MGCPDSHDFAGFVEQRLDPSAARLFEQHIDGCGACRRALALVGAALDAERPPDERDEPVEPLATEALIPGTRLGRYVVLRRIGRGGLGVVYLAYDPELDRRVAVKLLLSDVDTGPEANERLRREAQAMAKVTHPNVVAVYDAGIFSGCAFVAMEHVDGDTLAARLRRGAGRREVLAVFGHAAAGLCAVHDAGLVHRDFKPANVLVGADGRVRISDLGLARIAALGQSRGGTVTAQGEASHRTVHLAGTLSYMAPEQHRGEPVDARADQYAFCVALWEALAGTPPFRGAEHDELLAEKLRGPPAVPRAIPRRLAAALRRGLAPSPEARFPSMHALAAELRGPSGRPLIAALLGFAGIAVVATWALAPRAQVPTCPEGKALLSGAWDDGRREQVERAFAATGVPWSEEAFAAAASTLDRYAHAWAEARDASCALSLRPADPAHAMATLRIACLEDRRRELAALTRVLAEADAVTVENAATLVASLEPVEPCADDAALLLRVVPPESPEVRAQVGELRAALARVDALREAGRHQDATAAADALESPVGELAYPPLVAEWKLARAACLQTRVSGERTERALVAALEAAEAARHDRVSAEAWLRYARFRAWQGRDWDRAEMAASLAAGAIRRMGGDARLEDRLALVSAFILTGRGEIDAGLERMAALERRQRARLGSDDPALVATLEEQWRALLLVGRYEDAHRAALAAVAIGKRHFGAHHPRTGDLLHMRGACELRLGRLDEAQATLEAALTLLERAYGESHTRLDFTLADLARLQSLRGAHERAVALAERGVAIDTRTFSADAPPTAFAEIPLAEVLLRAGRAADAERVAEHAAGVLRAAIGDDHFLVVDVDALAALAAASRGGGDAARARLRRAHAWYRDRGGAPERRGQVALALARLESDDDETRALAGEAAAHFARAGGAWRDAQAQAAALARP